MTSTKLTTVKKDMCICGDDMDKYLIRIVVSADIVDELVIGSFQDMIDKFIELSFLGTKEEALKDDMVSSFVSSIEDIENNWSFGEYEGKLEQGYIRIVKLNNIEIPCKKENEQLTKVQKQLDRAVKVMECMYQTGNSLAVGEFLKELESEGE